MAINLKHIVLLMLLIPLATSREDKEEQLTPLASISDKTGLSVVAQPVSEVGEEDVSVEDDDGDGDMDQPGVFDPTEEWQTIREGQAIPSGLHVRINLQTGHKEAKLMGDDGGDGDGGSSGGGDGGGDGGSSSSGGGDGGSSSSVGGDGIKVEGEKKYLKYWGSGERQGMVNTGEKRFSREELKRALKEFKVETEDEEAAERRRQKDVLKQLRSYEDLKSELGQLSVSPQSDVEIISSLLNLYKLEATSSEHKVQILEQLEYLVHQVDNGVDFVKLGGLQLLLGDLNSTNTQLVSTSLHVLGSAAQGNPSVQVSAVEAGLLYHSVSLLSRVVRLLVPLAHYSVSEDVAMADGLTSPHALRQLLSRVIFMIGALVRHFPLAQTRLLELGGLSALTEVNHLPSSGVNMKYKVKVAALLYDLISEKKAVEERLSSQDGIDPEKMKQYFWFDIEQLLFEQGWCDLCLTLLSSSVEHDHREKVLRLLSMLLHTCVEKSKTLSSADDKFYDISSQLLHTLLAEYKSLLEGDVDDDYYLTILEIIKPMVEVLGRFKRKDEL